ncbi:uncharacterized protein EDB93DRAFT_1250371 [Suillus bovinus]|uniref:uncharacterized protein n=1 Tax=Suillus bovinus TaxID=48563 RepID=UPI001B8772B1|nr:uncharacterized protein EDB93DRAFT_1250371 [Suillus bovinus]KAG2147865.1 hypothetical protein EDB93DRAFT_1250371 [Suillus bovinus]
MYSEESKEIKDKIERKYRKAKARYTKAHLHQKSGKLPKIDNAMKIKAIYEVGPMLDCILRYLTYATGGWKFLILMGSNNPSMGEVSVFKQLKSGAQFDQRYGNFDAIQVAFLAFVKDALYSGSEEDKEDSLPDSSNDDSDTGQSESGSESFIEDASDAALTSTNALFDASPDLQLTVANYSHSDVMFNYCTFSNPILDLSILNPLGNLPGFITPSLITINHFLFPYVDFEGTGPTNKEAPAAQPEKKTYHAKCTQHDIVLDPSVLSDHFQSVPDSSHWVHKPFNLREYDNDIGASQKRA